MTPKYTAKKLRNIETQPGCWNKQLIGVFDGEQQVGEYVYSYSSGVPFYAFRQGEQWLALASLDYTATSILSLPDCKVLGGEKGSAGGFCPVEYYVPAYYWDKFETDHNAGKKIEKYWHCFRQYDEYDPSEPPDDSQHWLYEPVAFMSGCVWGDDWSWKLRVLDLKRAKEGLLSVINIGYIPLANLKLKQCLSSFDEYDGELYSVTVAAQKNIKLRGGDQSLRI